MVRVDHGGKVADSVLATVLGWDDLSVYFISLREREKGYKYRHSEDRHAGVHAIFWKASRMMGEYRLRYL